MSRVVALDVGARRIGVAVSDELQKFGHPKCVLDRHGIEKDVQQILEIATEAKSLQMVVGLPLELNGREGRRVSRVKALMASFSELAPEIEIIWWDERFSTAEALRENKRRRRSIDAEAAAVILQGWLDSLEQKDES